MALSAFRVESARRLNELGRTPVRASAALADELAAARAAGDGPRQRALLAHLRRADLPARPCPEDVRGEDWAALLLRLAEEVVECRQAAFDARRALTLACDLGERALARAAGDLAARAHGLLWTALLLRAQLSVAPDEDIARARSHAAAAPEAQHAITFALAGSALALGRHDTPAELYVAETAYVEVLRQLDPDAQPWQWAAAHLGAAETLRAQTDDPDEALTRRCQWHYRQALSVAERLQDRSLEAGALIGLAATESQAWERDEACIAEQFERAASCVTPEGEPQLWALLQQAWGDDCLASFRYEEALTHYRAAERIWRRRSNAYAWQRLCRGLGEAWAALAGESGEGYSAARRYYRSALQGHWDRETQASLCYSYARVLLALGRGGDVSLLQSALREAGRALQCLPAEAHPVRRARYLLRQAACLRALGRACHSRLCLRKAADQCAALTPLFPAPAAGARLQHALALHDLRDRAGAQRLLVAMLRDLAPVPTRFWLASAAEYGDAEFLALMRMVAGMLSGDAGWNNPGNIVS